MSFDNSLIRAFHSYRLAFVHLMHSSQITRQQFVFLAYLMETEHTKDFLTRAIMIKGLSWELANQYLNKLKRIGYTTKQGRLWRVTDKGRQYYTTFMQEFNRNNEGPFFWR